MRKRFCLLYVFAGIAAACIVGFVYAGSVPDTGQRKCYNNTEEINPCPNPGEPFYGQDAQYQGPARSYTKLGQNGVELPDTATQADGWIMTRDNVTGLIWEMKTDDGTVHDKDNKYLWSNAQSFFITQLKNDNFGGYSDWRLPTLKELSFLVNSDTPTSPTIDGIFFPNTKSSDYWSYTTNVYNTDYAYSLGFDSGTYDSSLKSNSYFYVRAVRGEQ
jgi:hypothetical protein